MKGCIDFSLFKIFFSIITLLLNFFSSQVLTAIPENQEQLKLLQELSLQDDVNIRYKFKINQKIQFSIIFSGRFL